MYKARNIGCLVLTIAVIFLFVSCSSGTSEEPVNGTEMTTTKAAVTTTTAAKTSSVTTTQPVTTTTTTTEKNPLEDRLEITWLKIYTQNWEE